MDGLIVRNALFLQTRLAASSLQVSANSARNGILVQHLEMRLNYAAAAREIVKANVMNLLSI